MDNTDNNANEDNTDDNATEDNANAKEWYNHEFLQLVSWMLYFITLEKRRRELGYVSRTCVMEWNLNIEACFPRHNDGRGVRSKAAQIVRKCKYPQDNPRQTTPLDPYVSELIWRWRDRFYYNNDFCISYLLPIKL